MESLIYNYVCPRRFRQVGKRERLARFIDRRATMNIDTVTGTLIWLGVCILGGVLSAIF